MKLKLFTILFLAASISAHAVPLVTYSFNGSTGSETTLPPDVQPSGATASFMSRGSGLTGNAGGGTFSSAAWTTDSSLDANDYFSFSLTPDAGYSMTITQLVLDERRSGTGIRNWSVRSSMDGFGSDIFTFSVPDNDSTRTAQTINFSDAFSALTATLDLRIYGYGAEGPAGTWRIDNVKVEGSTQRLASVPETLSFAFTACFLFAFLAFAHYNAPAPQRSRIKKTGNR